jgi:hypothetical protein
LQLERAMTALASWRFAALLLAALALTMESAHLLELPQKLQYGPEMYAAVNGTLYRYFAIVGGFYQLGSILVAAIVAYLVRKRGAAFRWTAIGVSLLTLAFVIWLAIVAPVNAEVARAHATAPGTIPDLWMRLRMRWELGHVAGFVVQLLGLSALFWSVLVETPRAQPPRPAR